MRAGLSRNRRYHFTAESAEGAESASLPICSRQKSKIRNKHKNKNIKSDSVGQSSMRLASSSKYRLTSSRATGLRKYGMASFSASTK
jgi:hypothetical protein